MLSEKGMERMEEKVSSAIRKSKRRKGHVDVLALGPHELDACVGILLERSRGSRVQGGGGMCFYGGWLRRWEVRLHALWVATEGVKPLP